MKYYWKPLLRVVKASKPGLFEPRPLRLLFITTFFLVLVGSTVFFIKVASLFYLNLPFFIALGPVLRKQSDTSVTG